MWRKEKEENEAALKRVREEEESFRESMKKVDEEHIYLKEDEEDLINNRVRAFGSFDFETKLLTISKTLSSVKEKH